MDLQKSVQFKLDIDTSDLDKAIQEAKKLDELLKKNVKQNRFKSVVVWASMVSILLLVARAFGVYDLLSIKEPVVKSIIDIILFLLTAFGVLNNPTSKKFF